MFPKMKAMKSAYEASMANKKEKETTTMALTEFNLPNYDIEVLKRRVMGLHSLLERIQMELMNEVETTTKASTHKWPENVYLPIFPRFG